MKNWKVYLRGILTLALMCPTVWPSPKAHALLGFSGNSQCTIGYQKRIDNFIANFNSKYPLKEVHVGEIDSLIGKASSVEAFNDPVLKQKAIEVVNFLNECASDDEEFTGAIYDLMASQFLDNQDGDKINNNYRPVHMLMTIIAEELFTPELTAERQANRDDYMHNVINVSGWMMGVFTLGTVLVYLRNPIKAWKENRVRRKVFGIPVESKAAFTARMQKKEAMSWWLSEKVLPSQRLALPAPKDVKMGVDSKGYVFHHKKGVDYTGNGQPKTKKGVKNHDQKPNKKYSIYDGLSYENRKLSRGKSADEFMAAMGKRNAEKSSDKARKENTKRVQKITGRLDNLQKPTLPKRLSTIGKDIVFALNKNRKKTLAIAGGYVASTAAVGKYTHFQYQHNHWKQLPIDMDQKLDEQNFMLALDVHCRAQELERTIKARNYNAGNKYDVTDDARSINQVAVAYGMIIRPDQVLHDPNTLVTTSMGWTHGGSVPEGIKWSKENGVATSTYGKPVECPTKKGLDKKDIAPNNEDSKLLISNTARIYTNKIPSEKFTEIMEDTNDSIELISRGSAEVVRQLHLDEKAEIDHQRKLKDESATEISYFDYLYQRLSRVESDLNQNLSRPVSLDSLDSKITSLLPPGKYGDSETKTGGVYDLVNRVNTLSPHEFNRWFMNLSWRFTRNPHERRAIYFIWEALSDVKNEAQEKKEELVNVLTAAAATTEETEEKLKAQLAAEKLKISSESERMAMAALVLALVHGDELLIPAHKKIDLFSLPDPQAEWNWSVQVARSIEDSKSGTLNKAQLNLNSPWARSPLVEIAAKQMSGEKVQEQDDSFFKRWISLGAFEEDEDKWSLAFRKTIRDVLPQFARKKLDVDKVFPLFVHLAANKFVCQAQEMRLTVTESLDLEYINQDPKKSAELMQKEAQIIANRFQVGHSALVEDLALLANVIPIAGTHSEYQPSGMPNTVNTFKCSYREEEATNTAHPLQNLKEGSDNLKSLLENFKTLKDAKTQDMFAPAGEEKSSADTDIPPPPSESDDEE